MFRPRIIPTLLLKNEGLVKTVKFADEKYIGDPINAVRLFNDYEADELVFLDIEASVEGRTISSDLVKSISEESFMPFSAGGGIKSLEDAKKIISAGAEKVVLNTVLYHNPEVVREISNHFGSQAVIVSIDVKKNREGNYLVAVRGGEDLVDVLPEEQARLAEDMGAGEILINSIDNDGTMDGFDYGLISTIANSVKIPVIAIGGAGNKDDLAKAIHVGASAVSAGSLFVFHGPRKAVLINYPSKEEIQEIFNTNNEIYNK